MPPRGVAPGTKRARQYDEITRSETAQGRSTSRAREIAARTVNKQRAQAGESRTRSRTSTGGMPLAKRGGRRSGTDRETGRTRDQLYADARKLGIAGRSKMSKAQLERAVGARR